MLLGVCDWYWPGEQAGLQTVQFRLNVFVGGVDWYVPDRQVLQTTQEVAPPKLNVPGAHGFCVPDTQ